MLFELYDARRCRQILDKQDLKSSLQRLMPLNVVLGALTALLRPKLQ
jgi:hypothetical protein